MDLYELRPEIGAAVRKIDYRLAFERYRNTDRPLQFFQMNYRVVAGGRTIFISF
jgi:hypothetical protein